MKMTQAHYQHIKDTINTLPRGDIFTHIETLKYDDRIKDLPKRLRWDLFHAAGLTRYSCDVLYNYLDDSHIDTALKQVCKDLHILC